MSEPDPQRDVVALLASPATHGGAPVETYETHASRVFAAGDRAFKLKRALRYSYLDYSTPERRRAACEAELSINRRFAPSLYRGVEPVTIGSDGRLHLGGEGRAVDWVVVMRRFDQALQFDRLAEAGRLTPDIMVRLAAILARVHEEAAPEPGQGGAQALAATQQGIAQNLRAEVPDVLDAALVEDWAARSAAAVREQSALLDARRASGRVRACHGDLHLRNICLLDGEPTPFDALEFEPAFSTIDVLYDLAFLMMDLQARGLGALGNALLNRYLDLSAESDGLALLPLFLSLRAAIRAEVAAAAKHRAQDRAAERERADEAVRYLGLARALIDPAPPTLIAIGGVSGTGKSTMAYCLAPEIGRPPGARVVRSDVLRKRAAGGSLETALPQGAYTPAARQAAYAALVEECGRCLAAGQAVIADATFAEPGPADALSGLARSRHVPFRGIWLHAPAEVLLRRVSARRGDASDAGADVVRAQLAKMPTPPPDWQLVENAGDAADAVPALRAAAGVPAA